MDTDRTPTPERESIPDPADAEPAIDATAADPNDEIPVPIAMFPAEIDERAQVVEALRDEANATRVNEPGLEA